MPVLLLLCLTGRAQTIPLATAKKILDTTQNPVGFVKFVMKKKYYIDTIPVISTGSFLGIADSLAYHGKVGKVYGPFKKANILLKVLVKAPNTFYHVKHILLDTATYSVSFAEKLADSILLKIKNGTAGFASMASTYSDDNVTASQGGDLGWFVRGAMLPQLDEAVAKHKKGEIFKVWTRAGLHIVSIPDDPKTDVGYALMLRVIL